MTVLYKQYNPRVSGLSVLLFSSTPVLQPIRITPTQHLDKLNLGRSAPPSRFKLDHRYSSYPSPLLPLRSPFPGLGISH